MNDSLPWLGHVARTVRRLRRRLGPRWVVAVSGGGDSVAMLRLLHGVGLDLSVAHLDHGARGEASETDTRFVAELAESLGLPFDLGHWRPDRPAHFEADARKARYAWLAEVARRRGASVVAVGHTRDDQAETILHRVVRGTGPHGLAGIPRCRRLADGVTLARPLLDVGRADLRDYLNRLGQTWREDATNADPSRTRARLRHDLLPRLAADFNPDVAGALVRLGALARSAGAAMDEHIGVLAGKAIRPGPGGGLVLDRPSLASLSTYLRTEVLRRAWREAAWPEAAMDARRWHRLAAWAARGDAALDVGAGVRGEVRDGVPTLSRPVVASSAVPPDPVPLDVPGEAAWMGGRVVASVEDVADLGPASPSAERLDLDRLAPPLVVDAPRPGDRFDPLGLDGRSMPLADFLRGRRVPRANRPGVPVVRDAAGILWVVGHRIGHRARLTGATRRVAVLRWIP